MCEKVVRPGRAGSMADVHLLGKLRPWCAQHVLLACSTSLPHSPPVLELLARAAMAAASSPLSSLCFQPI